MSGRMSFFAARRHDVVSNGDGSASVRAGGVWYAGSGLLLLVGFHPSSSIAFAPPFVCLSFNPNLSAREVCVEGIFGWFGWLAGWFAPSLPSPLHWSAFHLPRLHCGVGKGATVGTGVRISAGAQVPRPRVHSTIVSQSGGEDRSDPPPSPPCDHCTTLLTCGNTDLAINSTPS